MLFRDTARLITAEAEEDAEGYETVCESASEVFVDVKSVRREEFYRSMQAGVELTIAFDMRACDYGGQSRVEYDGKQYRVVRTFSPDGEMLELNCAPHHGPKQKEGGT